MLSLRLRQAMTDLCYKRHNQDLHVHGYKEEGTITVVDENNNSIKAQYIFNFEIPEFNKKYLVYTLDANGENNQVEVLISEIDYETNQIKSIPEADLETVMECYNNIINEIDEEE